MYPFLGDLNHDQAVDVVDIVMMLAQILADEYPDLFIFADINEDREADILDVVIAVEMIMGTNE